MVKLSPTERLEWLLGKPALKSSHEKVKELLNRYEQFLESTDATEQTLLDRLADQKIRRSYFEAANIFGDTMFELIELLGRKSRFHRLLVV
jgi:hypothetical protein